jgi:hypothetical protein
MHRELLVHQVLWSLLIGGATFVVAALWPLSEWACARRRGGWFALAGALTAACVGLDLLAAGLEGAAPAARWLASGGSLAGWLVPPLYLAFPAAVCVASAQSLLLAGAPPRAARGLALAIAALAVVVTPFAALGAACGLAGACF